MAEQTPVGAVAAAREWLQAVDVGDFDTAWALMDDNMRLVQVQHWLWANRNDPLLDGEDLDDLARELVHSTSDHPFWPDFLRARFNALQEGLLPERWEDYGAAMNRRRRGDDLDLVILLAPELSPDGFAEADTIVDGSVAFLMLMRDTAAGWRLAGHDHQPPEPGWPPTSGAPRDVVDT